MNPKPQTAQAGHRSVSLRTPPELGVRVKCLALRFQPFLCAMAFLQTHEGPIRKGACTSGYPPEAQKHQHQRASGLGFTV